MIGVPMIGLMSTAALIGCGDKDGDDTAGGDGGATADGGGTGDAGSTGDAGTTGDGGAGGGAAFSASGTYDGDAFTVECALDGTDPAYTGGLQCQDGIQFFAWCRPDPDHGPIGGVPASRFQVWFYLHAAIAVEGTHDLVAQAGLCVGDGHAAPPCTNSANIDSASVTVDSVTLWSAASGSFSAEWNDSGDPWAGDHVAVMSGSFDLVCPTE